MITNLHDGATPCFAGTKKGIVILCIEYFIYQQQKWKPHSALQWNAKQPRIFEFKNENFHFLNLRACINIYIYDYT